MEIHSSAIFIPGMQEKLPVASSLYTEVRKKSCQWQILWRGNMRKNIRLANITIEINLSASAYETLFDQFHTKKTPEIAVSVSKREINAAKKMYEPGSSEPYIEYMELCPRLSDAMISFNRVFFHGTAFLWHGKAWIFAAVSGTGKTTQYLLWKELYGEEVQIINGDKPVLAFDDGNITVHPSPWNGKEGMGQLISAPLGGIILLQQSDSNRIRKISASEAAGKIFVQFLFGRKTVEEVHAVCRLEETLLQQTPGWLLENRGDVASAKLCRNTLMEVQT